MSSLDAENLITPGLVVNGQHVSLTHQNLKGIRFKFLQNYVATVNNQTTVYHVNTVYTLSPNIRDALLAASAPMVAV
jgi:hypothetical protein